MRPRVLRSFGFFAGFALACLTLSVVACGEVTSSPDAPSFQSDAALADGSAFDTAEPARDGGPVDAIGFDASSSDAHISDAGSDASGGDASGGDAGRVDPTPGMWCGEVEGAGANPSMGATYYVSPTGNDDSDGSESSPWRSPEFASSNLMPGDTLVLEDGVYETVQWKIRARGTEAQPITIRSRNPRGALIQGGVVGPEALIVIGVFDGRTNMWLPDQDYWLVLDGLEVSGGRRHCLQVAGASHVTIQNSNFHDSGNDTIKNNAGSHSVLYVNNEMHHSNASGGGNSEGLDCTSSTCIVVRNNTIHHIEGGKGLYFKKGTHSCLAEYNLVYDVEFEGLLSGESSPDYESTIRNNVLYNIGLSCLGAYGSHASIFAHNTCYRSGEGGAPSTGAAFRASKAQTRNDADPAYNDAAYNENLSVNGNIFVVTNESGYMHSFGDPAFCSVASCRGGNTTNQEQIAELHSDYNVYWSTSASMVHRWKGVTSEGLPAWQAFSLGLGSAQDAHSLAIDPRFMSTTPGDAGFLRLAEGSPALGAAEDGTHCGAYQHGDEVIGHRW